MKRGTQEWKDKLRKSKLGEKNPNWKGDKAKYGAIHVWVRYRKPRPNMCTRCQERNAIDLANISGEYRRDVNDFEWLCRSCHMKGDGRTERFLINSHREKVWKKTRLTKLIKKRDKIERIKRSEDESKTMY